MSILIRSAAVASMVAFASVLAAPANAVVTMFDVSGVSSNDEQGSPVNEVFFVDIGAFSEVIGIGWDVSVTTNGPSWLSEMVVSFTGTAPLSDGIDLTVGTGDDFGGSADYSSGGIINVVDLGLNFMVGADGLLRLEFFEGFVDIPGGADAIWNSGALTVEYTPIDAVVPEPATWGMLIAGFGLVGFAARRRRQVALSA